MADYKVPQDVEADDKLIGPFSFRQFIYLIIVAVGIAAGWALFMLFPPLVIIPLPIIVFFGALALPLRKDQPMEIYLAAVLSYHLKPRKRFWVPDGKESLVQITTPKVTEIQRVKNLSQNEAEQRFDYLANLVDSRGWSVRGISGSDQSNSAMVGDVYAEAQQAVDVLDEQTTVSQNLNYMIEQTDAKRHQAMIDRLRQPATTSAANPSLITQPASNAAMPNPITTDTSMAPPVQSYTPPDPYQSLTPSDPSSDNTTDPHLEFNPYPTTMNQAVVQPLSQQNQSAPTTNNMGDNQTTSTSETAVSPDIINLANNTDLSIETIAREAHRINDKADSHDDEVVISLR